MAGKKYTKEHKDRFFALVDRGGTVRAAATASGVGEDAAYRWLREAGLSIQRDAPRVYSEEEKAAFFRRLAVDPNVSVTPRHSPSRSLTAREEVDEAPEVFNLRSSPHYAVSAGGPGDRCRGDGYLFVGSRRRLSVMAASVRSCAPAAC